MRFRVFFLILICSGTTRGEDFHAAVTESRWRVEVTEDRCMLKQDLPAFGQVSFARRSGEALEFILTGPSAYQAITRATVSLMPSPWQKDGFKPRHYQVYPVSVANSQGMRLAVYGQDAESVVQGLLIGRRPLFAFSYQNKTDITSVSVNAVGFQSAFVDYEQCLERQLGLQPGK